MQHSFKLGAVTALILLVAPLGRTAFAQFDYRAEVGLFADSEGDASLLSISPLFEFGYQLSVVQLNAAWGFTHLSLSDDDESESTFKAGSPYLEALYRIETDNRLMLVGLGIGIPLASLPDIDSESEVEDYLVDAVAYGVAASVHGLWDMWLWTPEYLPIVVPYRTATTMPRVTISGEAALAFYLPIGDNEGDLEVDLQTGAEVFGDLGPVTLGGRLRTVWMITGDGDGDDDAQISLEPFVRLNLTVIAIDVALTINLDDPLGFAFEDDGIWGLHIGLSGG